MGFEQELKIVARAYNQAQQGLQSTAQGIEGVAKSALNAAAASAKLNQAFGQAVAQAEGFKRASTGLYLPLDRVAEAEQRVAQHSHQMGQATDQAGQHMQSMGGHAGHAHDAMQELYMTLGMLGVMYGFQQAVKGLINVTREFGAEIKQASIISEDFTGTLQRQAMAATQGIFGPKELADVYRDLGSAGLNANQVLAATPDVLNFATAAMVEQSDAAQAVIAAASSFRIPFEQSEKITDAFAEAMNRTTLGGRDLVYALASIGPVAGMANQGLGETLAAVAALRNAGAHAQDAATSVRAAMLHLSAPADEAKDIIKQLGIEIFDAGGNMKQWSEIVAQFEKALGPYNQQTRNMVLTTVLGSDGIRAMASSMQMGSQKLADLAGSFENAQGSASRMAAEMAETVDGSIRRLTGNMQRAAIAVGEDLEPALTSLLGFLNTLVTGMANLDAGTRRLVETLIGGVGLLGAGMSVVGMAKMLFGALNGLGPVLLKLGTAAAATSLTLGGIVSIAGAVVAVLGLGYGAWKAYQAGQEQAAIAGGEQAKQLQDQAERVRDLTKELQELLAHTSPTADEQARMKQITGEIAKVAPEAAAGINVLTGQVTDLGKVLEGTNNALSRMATMSATMAKSSLNAAQSALPGKRQTLQDVQRQQVDINAAYDTSDPRYLYDVLLPTVTGTLDRMALDQAKRQALFGGQADALQQYAAARLTGLVKQEQGLLSDIAGLEQTIQSAQAILHPDTTDPDPGFSHAQTLAAVRQRESAKPTGGGQDGTGLFGTGEKPPTWISQWKTGFQAMQDVLAPYKQSLAEVGGALDLLDVKSQVYLGMLQSGRAGVEAVQAIEAARVDTLTKLKERQDDLHQSNEANRTMLGTLAGEQSRLDGLLAAGAIKTEDHAEASRTLRMETERLTQSIGQNSAAWWKDQGAIASAEAAAGSAEQALAEVRRRMDDQAYQSATGTMRHEVAMRRLSVDQQITLLRRMMAEMKVTTEQGWSLQESIASLYSGKMKGDFQAVADAYQASLDGVADTLERKLSDVDDRLKKTLAPLQKQLDELEAGKTTDERDRATTDHDKRLADLQKQRKYHELRTGLEHKKALADIDAQIADENLKWQRQGEDWTRDDKRKALEDQVKTAEDGAKDERKALEDAAKQQRKDLESHYKEVKRITESGILETIAALAATDPAWFGTGQTLIQRLIEGLKTGDFGSVLSLIDSVRTAADAAATAVGRVATPYAPPSPMEKNPSGTGRQPIPGVHAYATGAWEIPEAQMALLHPQETVLPAYAADAFRNFAPTLNNLDRVIAQAVDRVVSAIVSRPAGPITVYGAENATLEDPVDVDMLGRGIARQVLRLQHTGG